ncbi:MAG: universal stress protein [Deltaproteobacteria bacterium]|nr:universal stress protein [Deltaproteobacteria bacterium]MBW2051087.1 universal stress protein [Deltaproteobacteria bacterium]MBW2140308.1 universal stress protein [Deltaproteobacteria bacterium]MBW2322901.1 universal stress protein [Deltaproteobacteria bacterium]
MKKILLAIAGPAPRPEAIKYSLGLAQRLKAKLEVLQVISPSVEKGWRKMVQGVKKGSQMFDEVMITVTFAEAGEHQAAGQIFKMMSMATDKLRVSAGSNDPVDYEVTVKVGDPAEEITHFIKDHRDVILAVYDTATKTSEGRASKAFSQALIIPTVAVSLKHG